MAGQASSSNANNEEIGTVVPRFQFQRLLNQDQAGRRVSLLGTIDGQPAIVLVERAAFASDDSNLSNLAPSLRNIQILGSNDIYSWLLASSSTELRQPPPPDVKVNLILPSTDKHVAKYSSQEIRTVIETPSIYHDHVRPYMLASREAGRLNWVFNIIEGRTEQEDVIYREFGKTAEQQNGGFLLLPDLNWDRQNITSLHLLALVERRDIWSLRDLSKAHIPWLKRMRQNLIKATTKLYPQIDDDQLKFYVHYQPTYYHFHVHVVHVMLEAGATQAVGKAVGLESIIAQLETLAGENSGMQDVTLTYQVGEESDLWRGIFKPLKLNTLQRKSFEQ